MRIAHTLKALLAMAALTTAQVLNATTLNPVPTDELFQKAELIVQGVVAEVAYRNSDVDASHPFSLPHTFVTIRIEHTFKGIPGNGQSITLRFQGGPDGTGKAMLIPGVPLFDIGDRDVLFVRGNGQQLVPLVGWQEGRFRIVNDLVYSDAGNEVWLSKDGKLVFGKVRLLEEVMTHAMGATPLRFGYAGQVEAWTPPAGAKRLNATRFAAFVKNKLSQLNPRGLAVQRVQSPLHIQDRFYVEPLEAVPAPPDDTGLIPGSLGE